MKVVLFCGGLGEMGSGKDKAMIRQRISRRDFVKGSAGAVAAAAFPATGSAAIEPAQTAIPRWRGFNLTYFFTKWKDATPVEDDFRMMRDWGFDFVRLPMSYELWVQPGDWYAIKEETLERIDGLRRRLMDVDEPLVSADLEVFAGVLVLERALDHAVHVLLSRKGDGTGDGRATALRRLHDGLRAALDQLVIVRLQPDAYLLLSHSGAFSVLFT